MSKKAQSVIDVAGEIVQMLHTASLLIDDVEDNSVLRRGIPVAHKVYGVPSTINCANLVIFKALERCLALPGQPAAVFNEQMLELHRGQGLEIHWRDTFTCPSVDAYKRMTVMKTGGLFKLAVRLLAACSPAKDDLPHSKFDKLLELMGLYFQVTIPLRSVILGR